MHANKTKENKKFSVEGKKRESQNDVLSCLKAGVSKRLMWTS